MRWSDERYVRLYTRDTVEWNMLPWQSRALLPLLLRKIDRAGILELGKHGARGLAALVGLPSEVTESGLAGLLEDGCVVQSGTSIVVRNFIEAQEAAQSDALRAKEYRARERHDRVTNCDDTSRNVTEPSQNVANRHEPSRSVTARHSVPSLAVPSLAGEEGLSPQLALEVQEPGDSDPAGSPSALPGRKSASEAERRKVDKYRATAEKILDALNASRKRLKHTCRGITPSYSSLALIAERLDDGRSAEDCLHVIAVREAECRVNPSALRYFDAVSPFRRENFERTSAMDSGMAAAHWPPAGGHPVEPRRPVGVTDPIARIEALRKRAMEGG